MTFVYILRHGALSLLKLWSKRRANNCAQIRLVASRGARVFVSKIGALAAERPALYVHLEEFHLSVFPSPQISRATSVHSPHLLTSPLYLGDSSALHTSDCLRQRTRSSATPHHGDVLAATSDPRKSPPRLPTQYPTRPGNVPHEQRPSAWRVCANAKRDAEHPQDVG